MNAPLPTPPADACEECRAFVVLHPTTATTSKAAWLRGRFSHWDQRRHWLDRGDLNRAVDVEPIWDAPCGFFVKGIGAVEA